MKRFTTIVAVLLSTLLAACGGTTTQTLSAGARLTINVTTGGDNVANDRMKLGPRLVFSTSKTDPRPAQSVVLVNQTGASLDTSAPTSNSPSFLIDKTSSGSTSIAPGMSRSIKVTFVPHGAGVVQGRLSVAVAGHSSVTVSLGGLEAKGFEGSSEPNLQQIFDALGYGDNVAIPATPPTGIPAAKSDLKNSISSTRSAVGDEMLTPNFQRADETQPVSLVPLANYITRSVHNLGPFGINAEGSTSRTQALITFPGGSDGFGGQNQQLLPGLGDGSYSSLTPGSTVSFVPKFNTFGVWDGQHKVFSEDALNYADEHSMRIYPAKTQAGTSIANTYLVAEDSIGPGTYKNYDYQDVVFLISNVKPAS